jgi:hypothetical protein
MGFTALTWHAGQNAPGMCTCLSLCDVTGPPRSSTVGEPLRAAARGRTASCWPRSLSKPWPLPWPLPKTSAPGEPPPRSWRGEPSDLFERCGGLPKAAAAAEVDCAAVAGSRVLVLLLVASSALVVASRVPTRSVCRAWPTRPGVPR